MSEEQITSKTQNTQQKPGATARPGKKRDIFRFNGEKPTAINLDHVTNMAIEGNRISFTFYSNVVYVDLVDADAAKNVFEEILNAWVGDVSE